jgi:hypothetical protein
MYNKKELKVDLGKFVKPNPYKQDIITDPAGQWKYPGVPTRIPSGQITMQGVPYPVMAYPNIGEPVMMQPGQEYNFPGADYVDEYPEMKKGGYMPSLPNKKTSKAYSRSLTATNKLFAQSPLTKKSKSRKNKIFDPSSAYYQDGGAFEDDIDKRRQLLRDWTYGASIGMLQEQDGGIQDYIETELTPEEIEQYRQGGYTVEDISVPTLTKAQKGVVITDPKEYKYRKAAYDDSLNLYNLNKNYRDAANKYFFTQYDNLTKPTTKNTKAEIEEWKKTITASNKFGSYKRKSKVANKPSGSFKHYTSGHTGGSGNININTPGRKVLKKKGNVALVQDSLPGYQKPVQPVYYKKPETRKSTQPEIIEPNVIEPIIQETIQTENTQPIQMPLRDEIILPYGRSYFNEGRYKELQGGKQGYARFEKVVDPTSGKVRYLPKSGKPVEFTTLMDPTFKLGGIPMAEYGMSMGTGMSQNYMGNTRTFYQTGGRTLPKPISKNSKLITYKTDSKLIDGTAAFDLVSKVPISDDYNQQIKERLYTGKWGFDPESGALVKLNKSQQTTIPQNITNIRKEEKEDQEYRAAIQRGEINPRVDTPLISQANKQMTPQEVKEFVRQGYDATILNPAFQTVAYFTPPGMAIGAIQGAANLIPDLYEGNYGEAVVDAASILPFARPITQKAKSAIQNTYKINPWAVKEAQETMLVRARPVGQDPYINMAEQLKAKQAAGEPLSWWQKNLLNPQTNPQMASREKYFGQWFADNPSDLDFYINPETRNFADDAQIEILKARMPKSEATKYSVKNFEDAKTLSNLHDTEYILPKDIVQSLERFSVEDLGKLQSEYKKMNTPHWLKGYKEVPKPGTKNIVKAGSGGMDMSRYEIKNPDYFTQLLDTYTSKQLSPSSKKFYKGLIESVKKQDGIVTERQYQELQRLKTGDFNYGKKAYQEGGYIELELTPEEIQDYIAQGYSIDELE